MRTLRDLSAFDVFDLTADGAQGVGKDATASAPTPKRDVEALRASLARKLEAVLAEPGMSRDDADIGEGPR